MRFVIVILLLLATASKCWELYHDPAALLPRQIGHVIIPFVIAGEMGFGLLAFRGNYWRQLRFEAMALFTVFAGYSFYLGLQGAESCGCFGPLKVNPWWTFGLDVLVVAGLVGEWWWERRLTPTPGLSHEYAGEGQLEDPSPSLSPVFGGEGQLENPSPNLSPEYRGEGHVVGYRGEGLNLVVGRLTTEHEWFVQTPVEIRLRDGVVVGASTELPGIGGLKKYPVRNVAYQE